MSAQTKPSRFKSLPARTAIAAAAVATVFFLIGGWAMGRVTYDQRVHESTLNAEQEADLLINATTINSWPTGDVWGPFPYELVTSGGLLSSSSQLKPYESANGHIRAFMPAPEAGKDLPYRAFQEADFWSGGSGRSTLNGLAATAVSATLPISDLKVPQGNDTNAMTHQPANATVRAYVFVTPYEALAAVAAVDRVLYPAVPAAILLVAAVAYVATRRALWPVEAIRARTAAVTASDPRERVVVPNTGDEISRLATTINATLERLDQAARSHRRFVADAAHELRSPLASLLATLEVAKTYPDHTDWPQTVATAAGQARRIHTLADDLLLLARLDAAPASTTATYDVVDLAELARDLTADYAARGGTVTVHCDGEDPVWVNGNPIRLERLLRNLLDNAIRYADERVDVSVHRDTRAKNAVLIVQDDGPGIAAPDRERVFERFTRLDDDRARKTGGTGLGLAIAREIAEHEHGTLQIVNCSTGARFVARLPLANRAAFTRPRRPVVGRYR